MQKELELVTFLHISVVLSSTHVPLMETSIQGENQVLFLLVICIFVAVFFSFTRIFHLFKCNSSCHLPFAVDDCFFFIAPYSSVIQNGLLLVNCAPFFKFLV